MSEDSRQSCGHVRGKAQPRMNFRPFLVAALGLLGGIFLYAHFAFGAGRLIGAAAIVLALFLLLPPFGVRRTLLVAVIFAAFALVGAGGVHLAAVRFQSGPAEGEYAVTGTVESAAVRGGYVRATLARLSFDGERAGGKMEVTLYGEDVRTGDVLAFSAYVERNALPENGDSYAASDFAAGVRYSASPADFERTGRTGNVFLLVNGALYDSLHTHLEKDTAEIAYALLTGNSRGMDAGFLEETRTGGIAHVFAVSGLHIGMLYGAVFFLLRRPLRRWAAVPALLLAAGYCAMCAFTVSSVRSLLMCAFAGTMRFFGKKYDHLSSLSLAAVICLLLSPEQYFSIGFRLSYGAVAGIALFSGPLSRGLQRLKVPSAPAAVVVSGISAQIVTFPLMLDAFGYFSVWGTLLNLIVIPALPVLFLPLVVCAFLSLILPFWAGALLLLPEGLLSAMLFLFSSADFSAVLAGFSLGAGTGVWLALNVPLCGRVRLRPALRAASCGALCLLFALSVFLENGTFSGCRVDVSSADRGTCALVRTREHAVLLIDGDASLSFCEDFLNRTYGGNLDAVAVVSEDAVRAVNTAAFLPADVICTPWPVETGLGSGVVFAETFRVGEMTFHFEDTDRLTLSVQGCVAEFAFGKEEALSADLFVGTASGRLKYLLKDGIIKAL